jgi:hypothetical protein
VGQEKCSTCCWRSCAAWSMRTAPPLRRSTECRRGLRMHGERRRGARSRCAAALTMHLDVVSARWPCGARQGMPSRHGDGAVCAWEAPRSGPWRGCYTGEVPAERRAAAGRRSADLASAPVPQQPYVPLATLTRLVP